MTAEIAGLDPLQLDTIAFVVLLSVLPLVSYGAVQGIVPLWAFGLALLVAGALVPLVTELALREDEDDEDGENEDDEDGENEDDENGENNEDENGESA